MSNRTQAWNCPHKDRKVKALGKCASCYSIYSRKFHPNRIGKFATKCDHFNKKHFAKGMCFSCYQKTKKFATNCIHPDRRAFRNKIC